MRGTDFIQDLLKLHVSGLLAIEEEEGSIENGEDVQRSFMQFLHNFINRNTLTRPLLKEIKSIMVKYTYSPILRFGSLPISV